MKSNIPVLFVGRYAHEKHELPYMDESLSCAKNAGNEVGLLGQEHRMADFSYPLEEFEQRAKLFDDAYVHMSSNKESFERMAFRRWYIVLDYMEKYEVERLFLCENDVLLYANISEVLADFSQSALSIPEQLHELDWCVSGHAALWHIDDLRAFCDFSLQIYNNHIELLKQKWSWHNETNTPGGICDMTLLYLFQKENPHVGNLNKPIRGGFFDHNISDSKNESLDEYKKDLLRIKQLRVKSKFFESYNQKLSKWLKCYSLHFSGSAKKFLPFYIEPAGLNQTIRKWNTLKVKLTSRL